MKLITDNETLMAYVPNAIAAVRGETALFDKIAVHLQAAEQWLCRHFIDAELLQTSIDSEPLADTLRRIVVAEALRQAVPSLDLVYTPNGFAVVQTSNLTPASKQRVDRLIGTLLTLRDNAIEDALNILPAVAGWSDTPQGQFFARSLFANIDLPRLVGSQANDHWSAFLELQPRAAEVEESLAEDYFSPELLAHLRAGAITPEGLPKEHNFVATAIKAQTVAVLQDKSINARRMADVVNFIRQRPDDFPQWHGSSTAQLFSPPIFKNSKKSGGYFF